MFPRGPDSTSFLGNAILCKTCQEIQLVPPIKAKATLQTQTVCVYQIWTGTVILFNVPMWRTALGRRAQRSTY